MGSGVISYKDEKREKFDDFDMRADVELGTFKIRCYHFDAEAFVHPFHSVRVDHDSSSRDSVRGVEGAKELVMPELLSDSYRQVHRIVSSNKKGPKPMNDAHASVGNSFCHPKIGWAKDTTKRELEGWNPQSRKRMLARKISRKRFLLHLPCLWTSMLKKDYIRYIEELRRRLELPPLRSRQVSAPDLPRRQMIDSLTVITLQVMISLEFGNRHCRV
ncbi:hypothetical protein PIB30_046230 [Stylosanthes scabra]|uniref:Uncharacterized protein n=1 Tax=Stylosanthes scabra TaxID=79078 RepID=A0ABU6TG61_9FABA|nr:hypothetical protein [Stylosanthes scabra]